MDTPPSRHHQVNAVLQRVWAGKGPLARLLWPVAQLFGLLVRSRRWLYQSGIFDTTRVGVPVVVVGNVVAGGAGKTPVVMALAKHFHQRGIKVGILSRGYGRAGRECMEVNMQTPVSLSGDEAALLKRATNAPIFIAPRRADAAQALLAAYPATQLLLCDDGLQHYALGRDIEIAVFDDRGAGNGWLLPAGPLREPWPARLKGIDLVLHTGSKPAFAGYAATRRLANYAVATDGSQVQLSSLKGQRITALAGIANPQKFFDMLQAAGLTLELAIGLPDHYDFADFGNFSGFGSHLDKDSFLLCTEKDSVKLFALPSMIDRRVLAVPLETTLEPAFLAALDAMLAPLLSQLPSDHGH